jgi:hypothetical protein
MNHRQFFTKGMMLILALLVAACTAPKATPASTSEPQSLLASDPSACPTCAPQACQTSASQTCPTEAAQAMPEISSFRWTMASMAHAIITFEPGDKCSMKVNKMLTDGEGLMIDVVVNDNTYQDYSVWIVYVDPGKSLNDLKKLTDPITPPDWVHIIGAVMSTPMSRTYYVDTEITPSAQGPIYFTCQADGRVARKFIDHVGPLKFTGAP